jgi:GDP-4-dehydro-6-deoxy-D-mannose reductase
VRALVTGARGFVGRHLRAHLLEAGDDVVDLDMHPDTVRGDTAVDVTDRDAVIARVAEIQPDAIYHLAARSHVGESWEHPDMVERVNVGGTTNVLDAARRAGVRRVLAVGSSEQYGRVHPNDVPIREDHPLDPVSPYARSKTEAEARSLRAAGDGLDVICVRAFSHTGPGQSTRFLVPALAGRVADAERLAQHDVTVGRTDPVRDFSDVRDVVRAYRLLVVQGASGCVYNVCSGRGVSVGELATRLLDLAHTSLRLVEDPALVRDTDVPVLVGDHALLTEATGWQPEIPLDDTLRDVLAQARDQRV